MRGLNFGLGLTRGTTGGHVPPPRIAGNNLAYAIGDSRTRATHSPPGSYLSRYPLTIARQLLGGQMDLNYSSIVGGSGYTTQQVQESLFPNALASDAKTLILLVGVNDLGSNPVTVAGRIATMAEDWVESASDRVIHIFDECPWGGTTGDEDGHAQLRDLIRALSDPAGGINIVPSWQAITGGNDGITPLSDSFRDNVHFAIPGGVRVGRALAESLAPTLPAFDFHGQPTDFAQTFALGTLASNDLATNNAQTSGSHSVTMVEFEGQVWCEVDLNAVIGAVYVYRSSNSIPGGWVTGTTLFESNIDFVLREGHSNIRQIGLQATKQSGQTQPHYANANGVIDGAHSGSSDDAIDLSFPDGAELRGTFWTPRYRLAADATQLRPWWVLVQSRTSLGMSGKLLLRRPQCRVVT